MPKIEGTRAALESLTLCGTNLRWARLDAAHAAPLLYGARAARGPLRAGLLSPRFPGGPGLPALRPPSFAPQVPC